MKTYRPEAMQFEKISGAKRISFLCEAHFAPEEGEVVRVLFDFDTNKCIRMIGEIICIDELNTLRTRVFVRLFETDFPVSIS